MSPKGDVKPNNNLTTSRPQDPPTPTSTRSLLSPKRTPRQQDEFFDRLYKQETVSSAAHHKHSPIESGVSLLTTISPKRTPQQLDRLFDRLYHQDKTRPLSSSPLPPLPIGIQWRIRKKLQEQFVPLDLSSMLVRLPRSYQHHVSHTIHTFSIGKLSGRALAISIVDMLFQLEFMAIDSKYWEVYPATADEIGYFPAEVEKTNSHWDQPGEGEQKMVLLFDVEKKAIKDWRESYMVAAARGKIKIMGKEEIYVDEYEYTVSGYGVEYDALNCDRS